MAYYASGISADTLPFSLLGGLYGIDYVAASWGTVQLMKLSGDGKTYVPALTAFSANGAVPTTLPSGTYKLAVSGATGVYVQMTRIPEIL